MRLENIVIDARDPQASGRFWEAALGTATLHDQPDLFETRLDFGDHFLDLCFPRVADALLPSPRMHLDVRGGRDQATEVDRLIGLGARHLDIGQESVPWVVLADPEGNPLCVTQEDTTYDVNGPLASVLLEASDLKRDLDFWSWLTGWQIDARESDALRHPSGLGPVLEFDIERSTKTGKNRLHLDVRLEKGERLGDITAAIVHRGGRELDPGWGELPWSVFQDPSGNEFCVLSVNE